MLQEHASRLAETLKASVLWSRASRRHWLLREVKGGQVMSDLRCNLASSEADSGRRGTEAEVELQCKPSHKGS